MAVVSSLQLRLALLHVTLCGGMAAISEECVTLRNISVRAKVVRIKATHTHTHTQEANSSCVCVCVSLDFTPLWKRGWGVGGSV